MGLIAASPPTWTDSLTIYALALSPDGRTLASGSWDDTLKLWDVERGAALWSGGHPGAIRLAFALDGSLLASGGRGEHQSRARGPALAAVAGWPKRRDEFMEFPGDLLPL